MGAPLIAANVGARIPVGRVGAGDDIDQTLTVNGGALFLSAARPVD